MGSLFIELPKRAAIQDWPVEAHTQLRKFFSKRESIGAKVDIWFASATLSHILNIVHSVVRVVDSDVVGGARIPLSRLARLSRNFSSTIEALSASNFPMEILMTGALMSDPVLPVNCRSNAGLKKREYFVNSDFRKWHFSDLARCPS
jgi:hypothetical protein